MRQTWDMGRCSAWQRDQSCHHIGPGYGCHNQRGYMDEELCEAKLARLGPTPAAVPITLHTLAADAINGSA